jgi:hypothetical protein
MIRNLGEVGEGERGFAEPANANVAQRAMTQKCVSRECSLAESDAIASKRGCTFRGDRSPPPCRNLARPE